MRGEIMFNTDKPIERIEEDLLNRSTFSKELANAILAYTDTENFAISLCGEWGCGKTSILHMVVQEINKKAQDMPEDEKPIIINFNPWNYSDKNQLISQFFKEICQTLNKPSNSKNLNSVGEAIEKYSSVIDYTKYIPVAGQYIALLKPVVKGIGKGFTEKAKKLDSIESQKNNVINILRKLKQKLIVIIDDIDRLNNEQIRMIFQLVNSVAGFPNMIYLLSFDRTVVVRALSEEQKCDGEEYLEKIIQVPFDVPEAKKEQVHKVLFRELDKIIIGMSEDLFDKDHWGTIFRDCISKFIHSIRDVNRVVNAYKLKYKLMHSETNWVDLLCITTLQIAAPEIYSWIMNNISALAGTYYEGISRVQQNENKKNYLAIFESVYPKNPELMLTIVQDLFPKFSWKTGGYERTMEEKEVRRLQRVSSPEHSNLYFHLSLEDVKVSRNDVMKTIYDYEQQRLHLYLKVLRGTDSLRAYLQELNCCIEKIPEERLEMFFDEIIKLQIDPSLEENKGVFEPSVSYDCHQCIWSILERINEDNRSKLLLKYISSSTKEELFVLLQYIVSIEQAYGRIGNSTDYVYRLIPEEALKSIEEKCLEKLKLLVEDVTLLDNNKFYLIKTMWAYLDKDQFEEFMKNCLQDEKNVPKFLSFASEGWHGGNDSGWSFNEANISQYLTAEDMYHKVQGLKSTDLFNELTPEQKQVAIAFSLWYEMEDKSDYKQLSRKKINELLPQWIKE